MKQFLPVLNQLSLSALLLEEADLLLINLSQVKDELQWFRIRHFNSKEGVNREGINWDELFCF